MERAGDEQDLGAWSSRDAVEAWQRSSAARNARLAAATERILLARRAGRAGAGARGRGVKHMPNDGDLVDLFALMAPEPELQYKILVDDPARLYGF